MSRGLDCEICDVRVDIGVLPSILRSVYSDFIDTSIS